MADTSAKVDVVLHFPVSRGTLLVLLAVSGAISLLCLLPNWDLVRLAADEGMDSLAGREGAGTVQIGLFTSLFFGLNLLGLAFTSWETSGERKQRREQTQVEVDSFLSRPRSSIPVSTFLDQAGADPQADREDPTTTPELSDKFAEAQQVVHAAAQEESSFDPTTGSEETALPTAPRVSTPLPPPPPPTSRDAGWRPDPRRDHDLRYWDGTDWTEHVANDGLQDIDPL